MGVVSSAWSRFPPEEHLHKIRADFSTGHVTVMSLRNNVKCWDPFCHPVNSVKVMKGMESIVSQLR